ncbi:MULTISPECIES: hypothetical protein [unclassified Streptomyces]|uniref:hypothetical protein n=1 Tax=unclassified Streptomyces TaxID=2593676 RepID=UPI002E21BA2B
MLLRRVLAGERRDPGHRLDLPGGGSTAGDDGLPAPPDDLKAGITLTGRHEKKVHQAVLNHEGQINVLGRPWRTPITAARAATGSNKIDGWDFWRLTIAGVEQTLAEFRTTHFPPPAPA